ncbi:MAG TPA: hypothetical protein VFK52_11150 [Nocardioidaceae bacterium]|nr:hypothetical protein [Nocardioidaceae bacterium]
MLRHDVADDSLDGSSVGDVELHGLRRTRPRDGRDDVGSSRQVEVGAEHVHPARDEPAGQRGADPGAATGDDRSRSLEGLHPKALVTCPTRSG